MRKQTPAQDKALVFLNTLIREHRENRRSRLPTLPELSARAGVAPFTMHKAIQRLKKEGVLSTSHGRGIMLVPQTENEGLPSAATADSDRYVPNWHKLVRRLQVDIVKGVYLPDNQLPPLKFFMEKYGVGYPALRQALDFLCSEELLVPYKKSYRVPTLAAKSHHGSVVLIASGNQAGTLNLFTCRTHEHLRILENECSKIQTNLVIYTYEQVKARSFAPALFSRQSQPVLGFLVWTMGI
jgi:DNA-binding FadR family transcriptional regulator